MKLSKSRCLGLSLIALWLWSTCDGIAFGQTTDPRLEKVFADWMKRREGIKAVQYTMRGERTWLKGCCNDPTQPNQPDSPPRDVTGKLWRKMLMDFATNRHRLEIDENEYANLSNRMGEVARVTAFDGKEFRGMLLKYNDPDATPDPQSPIADIGVVKGSLNTLGFNSSFFPILLGHGLISYDHVFVKPGALRIEPDIEWFTVHGQAVHAGRACLVLRTRARRSGTVTFDEFWVDPTRDSAVLRQLRYSNGEAYEDADISYRPTSHGWLPERWMITIYDAIERRKARIIERMRVEELIVNPVVNEADFRVEAKPGMLVKETYNPAPKPNGLPAPVEKQYYRVGDSGQKQEVTFDSGTEARRWPAWIWPIGASAIAFVLWLIYRVSHKSAREIAESSSG